jgi:hypothetical protein
MSGREMGNTQDSQEPLSDARCDDIANETYMTLRATGWDGGMGGLTWDRALIRAALSTQPARNGGEMGDLPDDYEVN